MHPSINVVNYQPYIELLKKLCKTTPGKHEKQTKFFNSGAEAVENAEKMVRYYTKSKRFWLLTADIMMEHS